MGIETYWQGLLKKEVFDTGDPTRRIKKSFREREIVGKKSGEECHRPHHVQPRQPNVCGPASPVSLRSIYNLDNCVEMSKHPQPG